MTRTATRGRTAVKKLKKGDELTAYGDRPRIVVLTNANRNGQVKVRKFDGRRRRYVESYIDAIPGKSLRANYRLPARLRSA